MIYFDKKALEFLEHLEGHNSKEWFDENRERYHTSLKNPFDLFLKDLIKEVQKDDPSIQIEPKHAKFRINRDIRFSKNKQPYKTHISAVISKWGRKDTVNPGLYVHFWNDGVHFWTWCYQPEKAHLHAIRSFIMKHPRKVNNALNNKESKEIYGELRGAKNKRLPKEFQEAAKKNPLLFHKQFYFYTKYPSKHMIREDLIDFCMVHRHAAKPRRKVIQFALKEFQE